MDCSPGDCKQSDMTEQLTLSLALKAWSLNHWTVRENPPIHLLMTSLLIHSADPTQTLADPSGSTGCTWRDRSALFLSPFAFPFASFP